MYRRFFGLHERPFDITPNPRFLVMTNGHREALSNLEYGIASRKGITLLLGDAGTGKTTLIRSAIDRQPQRVHCVYLHNPALTRAEFIEMLAVRFHLGDAARSSKTALLVELETLLRERHLQNETTVLIVDEAQSLSLELLEEVRLLANIETEQVKLLSVVIAGQPELADRLNEPSLRQLKQRIALRCELQPLTQTETLAYVAGRIRAAGGTGAQVFAREAVLHIHESARGIPRTISVIADNALVAAFALGEKPVSTRIVAEVCRDLDLVAGGEHLDAPTAALVAAPESLPQSRPVATPTPLSQPRPVAAPAPVSQSQPVAAPNRIFVFENAAGEPAAAASGTEATGAEAAAHGGMFGSYAPKRRRFSIF